MTDEAAKELLAACPPPGSVWRHRKGGLYTVVCGAVRESDLTPVVVYRSAAGVHWVRPLPEFADGRFTREDA